MISEQKAIDLANLILSMDLITPRGQAARALARDILGMSTLHPTPQVITTNGTTRVIPYDEPLFLLRGQDIVAPEAVRAWAKSARRVGADPEIIRSAESQATAMEAWRERKIPDLAAGRTTA